MNTPIVIEHHTLSGNRKYRHTPWLAAQKLGIPQSYIWLWVTEGLLRTAKYVGKIYVHLEAVQKLIERPWLLDDAFSKTGEPIKGPQRQSAFTEPYLQEKCSRRPHERQTQGKAYRVTRESSGAN